jgi:aminoglycoside 6'-N-acetyltransferase I
MHIRPANIDDLDAWLSLRSALWPHCPAEQHRKEMLETLEKPARLACFVADTPGAGLCGFLEASLRDYADGCDTSPVGYIEGWYVAPAMQRQGVGRLLVEAAEGWAVQRGCQEMASDCLEDNDTSLAAHLALSYQEAERLIHFRKDLPAAPKVGDN